ncbi:MAG: tetratricopeptide repeat protein [Caldilinea sp. CFX5]|nr:tetratricopeptide repeat protein [Caldilinea sp. CFX5]
MCVLVLGVSPFSYMLGGSLYWKQIDLILFQGMEDMTPDKSETEHLKKLLQIHSHNLHRYEETAAKYGMDCPPHIILAIGETKENLEQTKQRLVDLGEQQSVDAVEKFVMRHNLPPRREFIGRIKKLEEVLSSLQGRMPIIAITGIGGIGKTAIALEASYDIFNKGIFEGIVWMSAKDNLLTFDNLLNLIARTFGQLDLLKLAVEEKRKNLLSFLRTGKFLLVLDNFETIANDEELGHFLEMIPEPSKVLITCRHRVNLESQTILIYGLSEDDSIGLIHYEGKRQGSNILTRVSRSLLLQLHDVTGGVPLALRWAISRIVQYGQSLERIIQALTSASGNIFEAIFEEMWQSMAYDSQNVLLAMPIFASLAPWPALEIVSGVSGERYLNGLFEINASCLLESNDEIQENKRRFGIHPLTRAFVEAKLLQRAEWKHEAQLRWAEYYSNIAKSHGGVRNWAGFLVLEDEFVELWAVAIWCYQNTIGLFDSRSSTKNIDAQVLVLMQYLITIGRNISSFLWEYGYWNERVQLCQWVFEVGLRVNDNQAAIYCANDIGWTLFNQGDIFNAEQWIRRSLKISEELGVPDKNLFMNTRNYLGLIAEAQGNYDEAEKAYFDILNFWKETTSKEPYGHLTTAQLDLGRLYFTQGKYDIARDWLRNSLLTAEKVVNYNNLHKILSFLGHISLAEGNIGEAKVYYQRGLAELQRIPQPSGAAACKLGLARIAEQEGDILSAEEFGKQSLEIFKQLHMKNQILQVENWLSQLR